MNPRILMSVPSSNESKLKEEGTNDIHPPSVSNNDLSGEHKFGGCHHSLTQNGHVRWHTKYQDPPYPPKGHVPCYFNIACFIQNGLANACWLARNIKNNKPKFSVWVSIAPHHQQLPILFAGLPSRPHHEKESSGLLPSWFLKYVHT